MGTTPATFNGSSTYAADLQQTITHAVAVASIPLNQLNANVTTLQGQSSELSYLESGFTLIQNAIQSLTTASNGGSLSASVGDSTVATATLDSSASATAGTYTLNVISPGSPTTSLSNTGLPTVTDPSSTSISTSSSFTLTVNGSPFSINPSTNSLNALAQAINSSGAGATATVINLGSPSAPSYSLSVQSTALGNVPIQLTDSNQNPLLTTLSTGTQAQYQVNGQPSTPISSSSSTVTLAPGLTVGLVGTGQTTISVTQDSTSTASAISSLVSGYNATVDELAKNRGTAGGALSGQSIVFSLQQTLQYLGNFSGGSSSVKSLADLGLTYDGSGHLQFDQSKFSSVAASDPSDLAAFLGTGTGGGFLATATTTLNGLLDPTNGLFASELASNQSQIATDNQEISDTQARITTMQNQLTAQMSAADALLSTLESQNNFMLQLFQAQNAIKINGG
jgi:flagellar hook-associated protein 2